MSAAGILRQLEAWAQEELGARAALAGVLGDQERALRGHDVEAVESTAARMQAFSAATYARDSRRALLMDQLAERFGVAAGSLTLGSIVERLGPDGTRLAHLRGELRRAAEVEVGLVRRNAALARSQCQISAEILRVLIGGDPLEDVSESRGGLIDARA